MLTMAAKRLRILVLGLLLAGVSTLLLAPSAGAASAEALRAIGTGCEQNGLPNSVALCDGAGRVTLKLKGVAVVSVVEGWVGLSGKSKPIRKKKKGKKRKVIPGPKPIVPKLRTYRRGKYRIYRGDNMYFYLPPGNWRLVINGTGVSVSAVGKGHVGVQQKKPRPRPQPQPITTVPEPGLISIAGAAYRDWPRLQELFSFGVDLPTPQGDDEPTDEKRSEADSVGSR